MGMTAATKSTVSSNSASLLQAGGQYQPLDALIYLAILTTSIILSSFIFNIGAILQLFFPNNTVGTGYAGHIIAGVSVGIATVLIPMYSSETAPKEIRSRLGSMFQFFFTLGVFTSYWIDYAVAKAYGINYNPVTMDEILAEITKEKHITEGVTWREYLVPANGWRMFLIFNAVEAGENAFLFSGFFGLVKLVSCFFFLMFLVERIGRRGSLIGGAFIMGVYMLIVVIIAATHPPNPNASISFASVASLTIIYLEAMTYNISWGPLYMSEIFPTRIREGVIAITPHAIDNLGWKTFLMFSIFNFALMVYAFLVIKETKGRSLEEMEILFNAKPAPLDVKKSPDNSIKNDKAKTLDKKH
ncbi:hypothetical protein QQZ08_000910 [Neonectria magnoliae]|uniref:Major facilitator superfamily (MFS) profile domain-containing protein n=1 Tax=Neonectria magnoliae TaxID=2732573 RepID=A0ABR1IHK9_9HYPO